MELEQSMITASLAKKDRLEIVNEVNDENQSIDHEAIGAGGAWNFENDTIEYIFVFSYELKQKELFQVILIPKIKGPQMQYSKQKQYYGALIMEAIKGQNYF